MLHVMTCLSCHSTVGERHHRLGSVQGISPRVPRICTFTIVDGDDWIPEMSGTEGILRTLGIPKSSYLPTKVVVLNQNYLGGPKSHGWPEGSRAAGPTKDLERQKLFKIVSSLLKIQFCRILRVGSSMRNVPGRARPPSPVVESSSPNLVNPRVRIAW
ncbi:hypothetical protein PV10_00102 [Exophiala mesophila]|uniref:Uncharacterized protein n=1 Tax=Exophiala mesophila TaxID=212818 RepID=A0A0D1ZQF1_EXOME|nr:uncharacterized protein PV10_00102 [Exophiala mesophila]KIV96209.1 hypothetical protein PV10_00102 [Exophiala mesophila]